MLRCGACLGYALGRLKTAWFKTKYIKRPSEFFQTAFVQLGVCYSASITALSAALGRMAADAAVSSGA